LDVKSTQTPQEITQSPPSGSFQPHHLEGYIRAVTLIPFRVICSTPFHLRHHRRYRDRHRQYAAYVPRRYSFWCNHHPAVILFAQFDSAPTRVFPSTSSSEDGM
jgi:hypothetical protein